MTCLVKVEPYFYGIIPAKFSFSLSQQLQNRIYSQNPLFLCDIWFFFIGTEGRADSSSVYHRTHRTLRSWLTSGDQRQQNTSIRPCRQVRKLFLCNHYAATYFSVFYFYTQFCTYPSGIFHNELLYARLYFV